MPLLTQIKKRFLFSAFLILCCLVSAKGATAMQQQALSQENKIKAAYVLNFTRYIQWPALATFAQAPLHLCLASSADFYDFIANIILRANASGLYRPIRLENVAQAVNCELTYLQNPVDPLLPQLRQSLLVVESAAIVQPKTAITFYISQKKVRFGINMDVINGLNIRVSSELLKLARIKHNA